MCHNRLALRPVRFEVLMTQSYSERLLAQLGVHKHRHHPDVAHGTWRDRDGRDIAYKHILPQDSHRSNILPTISEPFWAWFDGQTEQLKLHRFFHHLNSSQAMAFNLFFPFLTNGRIDPRLLKVVGITDDAEYTGSFEKVLHPGEGTNFDFYMESAAGRRIFFELKLSESEFGSCANDARHQQKLEEHYHPYLKDDVDAKWLEPATFCANYQVLRNLSYLGRYPDSGVVFIFPKANEQLMKAENTIKQIVSKSFAPRVAILYLEYLVETILKAVAGDEALTMHYLAFRDKYVCL
jgi:hypothetical protein